jgi:deoxyribose-phosphate aldolase
MVSSPPSTTLTVSLPQLAKTIDHSLLHPTLTDAETRAGLELSRRLSVATACVKPYAVPLARQMLAGSGVGVCAVIGFPHGNSTTEIKVAEAIAAVEAAAGAAGGATTTSAPAPSPAPSPAPTPTPSPPTEIDMVINIGKALSGEWEYVADEIARVQTAVAARGALLKVIFETAYLRAEQIARLCAICSAAGVAFVKTSTGYAYVKQETPSSGAAAGFEAKGSTPAVLALMRTHAAPGVQIKAAGGIRSLDSLLAALALGVTRVGATATAAILDEARARGIGDEPVQVHVPLPVLVPTTEGAQASGAVEQGY